ncbi:MAG: hypothetical protein WCH98_12330 [Verrucomicrobiota bacterium]
MKHIITFLATAVLLLCGSLLHAAVPTQINYQGRLTDANGAAVSGTKAMAVKLYDAPTGGNLLYSETIGNVTVTDGVYRFAFGGSGAGIAAVLTATAHYLALVVDGAEQPARTQLLTVPFALKAAEATATAKQQTSLVIPKCFWYAFNPNSPVWTLQTIQQEVQLVNNTNILTGECELTGLPRSANILGFTAAVYDTATRQTGNATWFLSGNLVIELYEVNELGAYTLLATDQSGESFSGGDKILTGTVSGGRTYTGNNTFLVRVFSPIRQDFAYFSPNGTLKVKSLKINFEY